MVVEIEDVLGIADQPNVPGTTNEHPNWRQRLPVPVEELASHEGLRAVAAALTEEGRDHRSPGKATAKPRRRAAPAKRAKG